MRRHRRLIYSRGYFFPRMDIIVYVYVSVDVQYSPAFLPRMMRYYISKREFRIIKFLLNCAKH